MASAMSKTGRTMWRALSSSLPAPSRSVSTFTLPPLKYEYNALEPYFDEKTMTVHHTRHHQTYVSNLNAVLTGEHGSTLQGNSLADIQKNISTLPDSIRTTVTNHGGGHYNHSLFFSILKPESERSSSSPVDELKSSIDTQFGGIDEMRKEFNLNAMKVFGSGWAWLSVDSNDNGKLKITSTKNQENPLMGPEQALVPILGLDIWEHAMYLKYLNRRPEYIDAFWNIVDWEQVAANYASAKDGGSAMFDVPMEEEE